MAQFTFFWSGPFSQWHPSPFVIGGVCYNTAEQWMMAEKARLFRDDETLAAILAAVHPREQKALGRKVRGFNREAWEAPFPWRDGQKPRCWQIVWRGNEAKYLQNDDLRAKLLATANTTLVEASPHDTTWGIGLSEQDAARLDRATWRGRNWLGEVLTDLREVFLLG